MTPNFLLFALSVLGSFCLVNATWPPACTINPCKNSGICVPSSVGYYCRCTGSYTGRLCEKAINACLSNPCLGGGTCAVGSYNRHWYCICPSAKTGLRCEQVIHDCSSQPCQNDGSCCENQSGYTCDCKPGFTGNYCETDIDECLSEPCQNGATCVDQVNGYSCTCRVGLEGRHCERKKLGCQSTTCLNGGSCAESNDGMWYCVCPRTYKGIQCEQLVNDCSSHPCQNGGSCCDKGDHYDCTCPDGFSGKHCETKPISPSSPSSVTPSSSGLIVTSTTSYVVTSCFGSTSSSFPSSVSPSPSEPISPSSPSSVTPTSSVCDCVHSHGICRDGTCVCHMSYYGPRCEYEYNLCTVGFCGTTAACSKIQGDLYTCISTYHRPSTTALTSTPFTTIQSTSTIMWIIDHICDISQPCRNNGICIKTGSTHGYRCQCGPGYTGRNCENYLFLTTSIPLSTILPTTTLPHIPQTWNYFTTSFTTSSFRRTSGPQTTILTTPSSSLTTVSSSVVINKRSRRDILKNIENSDVEDKELKRICKLNELKAKKIFNDKQLAKKSWKNLHPGIKAVLIDLVANNDHRRLSGTHAQIKKAVAGNDLMEMSRIMAERNLWKRVPVARFWKRKQMMKKVVKNPWKSLVESQVVC
ncbi:fibropellin-1-like [Actinia tenebrosa]|uniref:Fibropellin-1-like n=1 Tax=Actinia tenebrosa TaxID=6105 RepID=A0A6P8IHJ0_ACTTE|nr:fibropellin-1-like [Actinia tenebrosa]